jgi:hypothetical protein
VVTTAIPLSEWSPAWLTRCRPTHVEPVHPSIGAHGPHIAWTIINVVDKAAYVLTTGVVTTLVWRARGTNWLPSRPL